VNVKSDNNQTTVASYTYGDSNERLILEEAGVRTYYACDGSAEYTESGNSSTPQWSKTSIYLGARLLSTLTPNGSGGQFVQYHHPDHLGTRLVTNAQDTNYFEQQTLPFGTALNELPPTGAVTGFTNRRFTTYDRSLNTGLDYAINRHLNPPQGRFTQVDPIGMNSVSLSSPQTLNLYAYCTNDPINHVDPSGLGFFSKLFKWIGKALKILTIVALVVMTLIIFAPASSFIFQAALWMFSNVLLPLSQVPVLGAFVPLGSLGSPQWNPGAVASSAILFRARAQPALPTARSRSLFRLSPPELPAPKRKTVRFLAI
jgi:RHS repeat-associated protein